jgi:hypothetical protein
VSGRPNWRLLASIVLLTAGGPSLALGASGTEAGLDIGFRHTFDATHGATAAAAAPIPAFARMYGTACSTCHIAAPKLNVLGEAFRLNGYRMVDNDLLVRQDEPVSLGADPWKELWPRAIWPSDLPGQLPLALRIQSDMRITRDLDAKSAASYEFPHEVYFLAGAPLGESISVFLEGEWKPGDGLEFVQARATFANVLPGIPDRAANLTVGLKHPYLFTFTDGQLDRAGMLKFGWQSFRLSSMTGLLGGRIHYGVGLAQAGAQMREDLNGTKDLYYSLRWKLGGLDYAGHYSPGGEPVLGTGGQLLDRSLTLEHFGYFGDDSTPEVDVGSNRSLGWAARLLNGPLDLGVGHVRRNYTRAFEVAGPDVLATTWFAKVEYLVYPWVIASLKADRLTVDVPAGALPTGFTASSVDREFLAPGVIFLIRQNVRAVLEGELVLSGDARSAATRRPHALWMRLDLAF